MNNIKKYKFSFYLSILVVIFAICIAISTRAQEMGDILYTFVGKDSISLYVQGTKDMKVTAQIGTKKIKDVNVVPLDEIEKIETLILVDNSLSTTEDIRPKIAEMLTGVIGNRLQNESISIATFSKDIDYKANDTTDYTQLKRAVDSLEYKYQDAYLLPIIYDLIKEYAAKYDNVFRRVIVISDGASDEEIGVTVGEVTSELKKNSFPIYTFGCKAEDGSNNNDLENLYSISRTTGAEYWTINDINNPADIAAQFSKRLAEIDRVDIKLPKSLQDGSEKGVKLSMVNGGLSLEASTTVKMPFSEATNVKFTPVAFIVLTVAVMTIIILLIILIVVLIKKKDNGDEKNYQKLLHGLNNSEDREENIQSENKPAPINHENKSVKNRIHTVAPAMPVNVQPGIYPDYISSQNNAQNGNVSNSNISSENTLPSNVGKRASAPMIAVEALGGRWEISLLNPIIIGRSSTVDIQLNDRTVSKKHCKICFEQDKVYIEDLKSSNHTFIGRQDIAEIGRYHMKVNMLKMRLGDVDVIVEVIK